MCWSALSEAIPLYPLYALLFVDAGLSEAQVSALFVVWASVGLVAEVPCGVWADRHSRRAAMVLGGVLQAVGYVAWTAAPAFWAFALGFILWGLGGALGSGSVEALVHDGLSAAGAADRYASVMGRAEAAALAVQLPVALAAGVLFAFGGYPLAGWASVAVCLAAALLASRMPETDRPGAGRDAGSPRAVLRSGLGEVGRSGALRWAVASVALLGALDGIEEYTPILASSWGVRAELVPLALLAIPLAGALGATLGGRAEGLGGLGLGLAMLAGAGLLALAAAVGRPAGLAGVAAFYGLYRMVLIVADARMQARVTGPARATVTSLAALSAELAALVLFGAWALGGLAFATALVALVAVVLALSGGSGDPGRDR